MEVDEVTGDDGEEEENAVGREEGSKVEPAWPKNADASSSSTPLAANGQPQPPPSSSPSSPSKRSRTTTTTTEPASILPPSAFATSIFSPVLFTDQLRPLPQAPPGKAFRLLHSPKIKLTFTLTIVAGRYYPLVDLVSTFRGEPIPLRASSPSPSNANAEASTSARSTSPSKEAGSSYTSSSVVARSLQVLAGGEHYHHHLEAEEPTSPLLPALRPGGILMGPTVRRETRLEMVNDPLNAVKDKIKAVWKA